MKIFTPKNFFFILALVSTIQLNAATLCLTLGDLTFEAEMIHSGPGTYTYSAVTDEVYPGTGVFYTVTGTYNKSTMVLTMHAETAGLFVDCYTIPFVGISIPKTIDATSYAKIGKNFYCDYSNACGETGTLVLPYDRGPCEIFKLNSEEDINDILNEVEFEIYQNGDAVEFAYSVFNFSTTEIIVYDLMGNQVEKLIAENNEKGSYSVRWNNQIAEPKMYIATFKSGDQIISKVFLN